METLVTLEELDRLRSTDELNIDTTRSYSMAIGAQVWDETYTYNGANGGWLSRTIRRNVRPTDAATMLADLATNKNLRDLHAYVEGF